MNQIRTPSGPALPRSRLPLVALALIAGVILAVTLSRNLADDPSPGPAQPAVQTPQADPGLPPAAARSSSRAGATKMDPQTLEQVRLKEERQALAEHGAFARQYSAERVDAQWAGAKEAELMAASKSDQISQLGAEPQKLTIDCRRSMCLTQADFASRTLAEDWMTWFLLNAGEGMSKSTFEYSMQPDGTARINVYGLARK